MDLINRAIGFGRKNASAIKKFGSNNTVLKTLSGINNGLKSFGSGAVQAKSWYDRAVGNNVIPKTMIGDKTANIVSTIGRLA